MFLRLANFLSFDQYQIQKIKTNSNLEGKSSMSQLSGRKLRGRCEFGHKTNLNKLLALNSVAVSQNLVDRSKFGPNAS